MEMQMKGFKGQPVEGSTDLILGAKPSTLIRSCNLKRVKSFETQDECEATWYENTPQGVAEASATAYFFAKRLYDVLGIPVGIINVSWGGTPIQAWMNPELLKKEFAGDMNLTALETKVWPEKNSHKVPGVLYNGMLHSVTKYTAKGFIWYQGCDNRKKFELYKRLQPAFVKMLRQEWENEDMPFYFTQIAPYKYEDPNLPHAGYMMWAQAQTLELIPRSGMACLHDAGEFACIHPANKKAVGDRLAFQALENDYGVKGIDSKTPIPVKFEFKDGEAIVTFDFCSRGLSPISTDLDGFELAGEDKVFYPAKGRLLGGDRKQIKVYQCPEVPNPVAVRYGMKNWSVATLFNCFGIPATPFRSDNWE
jgi:sialate O-acetylesterase